MDNPSDYYYNKGLEFLKEENYYEALMYLDKSIELNPDVADYYADKAICLLKLESFEKSIDFINHAMDLSNKKEIKNKKTEILLNVADNLINEDEIIKAEEIIDELMIFSPNNEDVVNKKSEILIKKIKSFGYDEDEKLEILDEIIELNPDNIEFINQKTEILAVKLDKIKAYGFDEDKILEILDEILKVNPDNEEFINQKTEILIKRAEEKTKKGNNEDALKLWTEIVNLNPQNHDYKDIKIGFLKDKASQRYELGNIDACIEYWNQIIELNPDYIDEKIEILLGIANDYFKKGNNDDCINYLDKIAEIDSKYIEKETEFLLKFADKEYKKENINSCLYFWDKIIDLNPNNLEYIERKFEITYNLETKEETNNVDVLKSINRSIDHQRLLFRRNGYHKKELECCENLIEITESNEELNTPVSKSLNIIRKVDALLANQKFKDAIKIIDEVINVNKDNNEKNEYIEIKSNVFLAKSRYYYEKKKFDQSLKYAEDALNLNEENEGAMALKADSIKLKGNYLMHISEYEKALNCYDEDLNYINESPLKNQENTPNYIANIYNLKGICFKHLFKYEEAMECFNHSLNVEYSDLVDINKIETLCLLNGEEEALTLINLFLENKPFDFRANRLKLEILIRLKRFKEAYDLCYELIDEDYMNKKRWKNISFSLFDIKQCSMANDLMNNALRIEKNNHKFIKNKMDCLYNFSYELFNAGFTYYSLDCVNELIDMDNENPGYWQLKGKIFDRLTNFKESKKCFDKSLELVN